MKKVRTFFALTLAGMALREAPALAQPGKELETVIVTGRRVPDTPEVVAHDVIRSMAAPSLLLGTIGRWQGGLCPRTDGLSSRTSNNFVTRRIREVAALVGAPLADEPCKSNVEVLFNHEVVDVHQTADAVSVDVRGPDGVKKHSGAYLIGADGGRSIVRKRSDIPFEGFTWPERFLVLTTPFDFERNRGYSYRSYFAEPGSWCNCFKVSADGPPGLWRTVYPTEQSQSDDALMSDAGVQERMHLFFPDERPYEVVHRNLYVTHQRVATTFRKGRVVLAGDAAHVNNPIGGMGLNGGIQDAINLAEKLIEVILEGKSDSLLDLYDLQRRTVAVEFVQEQSIANKKRLEESDPVNRKKNLDELSRIAEDPKRSRQFLLRTAMIASQRRADSITLG